MVSFSVPSIISLSVSILSILGVVISVILFFGRLRWEMSELQKRDKTQEKILSDIRDQINNLKESGSIPTVDVTRRVNVLENSFFAMNAAIQQIQIDMGVVKSRVEGKP